MKQIRTSPWMKLKHPTKIITKDQGTIVHTLVKGTAYVCDTNIFKKSIPLMVVKHPVYKTAWYVFDFRSGWLLANTGGSTRQEALEAFELQVHNMTNTFPEGTKEMEELILEQENIN